MIKNISLKKSPTNIKNIWSLYRTLKGSLSNQELLINEVSDMLGRMTPTAYTDSLSLMYTDYLPQAHVPAETLTHFIQGIKHFRLFEFVTFIEVLSGRSKR